MVSLKGLGVAGLLCLGLAGVACSDDDAATSSAGSTSSGGEGGKGGVGGMGGFGGSTTCPSEPEPDTLEATRATCQFTAGAHVEETLGFTSADRAQMPITHLVVVMQENRSFDHYFGGLAKAGQPEAEGPPEGYVNPDDNGVDVAPFHLDSACLEDDPPHQWTAMHTGWNEGAMDGFVKSAAVNGSDGHYAMGYYDETDLPFYYWMAKTFALADHYFGSALGGTWANRDYLYAATSDGVKSTGQKTISVPTIFDSMDDAGVTWGVYTDGNPRQDSLGWDSSHAGVGSFDDFISALGDGTLPAVSFVDPGPGQDEHPANDIHEGEIWGYTLYKAAIASPLWSNLAIVYTYDESGGLADHMPPPPACIPSPDQDEFDRLGVRVPMVLISPWARPGYVSHRTHEHTSVTRLIELLHDLPALTARDASADALLDLFDFACGPAFATPPAPTDPGLLGCP